MKTEDDVMVEVMGYVGESQKKRNKFNKECTKATRATGSTNVAVEVILGVLIKMGLGDNFDSMEFLTKYLVNNDKATLEKHTADHIIKGLLEQNNELLCDIAEVKDKVLSLEQCHKYDKSEIETLKIANGKLKNTSDSLKDELKVQLKDNKELRKNCDRELETNIELMDENEKLEYDNNALKHIIKICG